MEIVEPDEPSDDVRQGFGHRRIDGVGVMRFAAGLKAIDGRLQGSGYLAAFLHSQALGGQPGDYLRVIGGA